jgi:hypothetical protein
MRSTPSELPIRIIAGALGVEVRRFGPLSYGFVVRGERKELLFTARNVVRKAGEPVGDEMSVVIHSGAKSV